MNIVRLSRLSITGNLDTETPWPVIHEVAVAHGVSIPLNVYSEEDDDYDMNVVEDLIREIERGENDLPCVNFEVSQQNALSIARFVNPYIPWRPEELEEAFHYMLRFANVIPPTVNEIEFGLQEANHIERLNSCMLLKLCQHYNISVNFYTTDSQMADVLRIVISHDRTIISRQLDYVNPVDLPRLYMNVVDISSDTSYVEDRRFQPGSEIVIDDNFHSNINDVITGLNDTRALRLRVQPKNSYEALILSALLFKIDISESSDPITEYINLRDKGGDFWIPLCDRMRKITKLNPRRLRLDLYFNPHLPIEMYDDDDLHNLALTEGYNQSQLRLESPYSLLVTSYLSPTFYHGKFPSMKNQNTLFSMQLVDKLHHSEVVCYGLMDTDNMIAFTYSELSEYFRINKTFANPESTDGGVFSNESICKLKSLCGQFFAGDSKESVRSREELLKNINVTQLLVEGANNGIKEFYDLYHSQSEDVQEMIQETLYSWFVLAMNTRGWLGEPNAYPISEAPVENQNLVDIRVTESIAELRNNIERLNDIGETILNLPLWQYRNGWISINSDGRILRERLEILTAGESYKTQDSCMRLSSNSLSASIYRYMEMVDMPLPFDINSLKTIS